MSSTRNKLTLNATSSMIQVAFTAILYFFLYKYLLNTLGVQQLGVWSLILSFSSIANLANLGLTSGLVKFVADYLAEKKEEKIGKLILTSFISLTILFVLVSLIILFGAKYFLHFAIKEQFLNVAFSILPFSLGSLCINTLSGVFTSVLEGHQKNYIRNFIFVFSNVVMYGATILLTPVFQLKGVAMAQLLQSIFVLVFSLLFMIKINPFNRLRYWKWSNQSLKELFNYGYKFSAVSICQLLYEPMTKTLLSRFGGEGMLGVYELANRMVSQFRALLVSANQVVIPVIAESVKTKSKEYLTTFYADMNRMMLLLALPLATIVVILAPIISIVWIGENNDVFTFSTYVLTISAFFNIMCGPAYFSSMGQGRLNVLVVVHVLMAVLNLIIGYLLGNWIGGYGIILAWGFSLSIGSYFLVLAYNRKMHISFKQIYRRNEIGLLIVSAFIMAISILFFSLELPILNDYVKTAVCCILLFLFVPVILKNQNFKGVMVYFKKK